MPLQYICKERGCSEFFSCFASFKKLCISVGDMYVHKHVSSTHSFLTTSKVVVWCFFSSPVKNSPFIFRKQGITFEGGTSQCRCGFLEYTFGKCCTVKKFFTASSSRLYCVMRTFLHYNYIVTGHSLKFNKGQYLDWIPDLCIKPVCIKATIRTKMRCRTQTHRLVRFYSGKRSMG